MVHETLWQSYRRQLCVCRGIDLSLDISRMRFEADYLESMAPRMQSAFDAMQALEDGAIANPDENRRVGHYWLRTPELSPNVEIRQAIVETLSEVKDFSAGIHSGQVRAPGGGIFTDLLVIGIGGSALGPQWIASALGHVSEDKMRVHFLDNTDPEGMEDVLTRIEALSTTLVLVISKSGGTPETRNGMIVARRYFESWDLGFSSRAVAITGLGSSLYQQARQEGWLKIFPMWDWVGGRTSELSVVGLLPAALQGIDVDALLAGASACDGYTRRRQVAQNPAALMALMWYAATDGKGSKDLVVLPYKDKLLLFSRYLQQLIMESLGKSHDLDGKVVQQGLTVYGNKGSTDQHAYVQQLRDGIHNFFVTFIDVLEYGAAPMNVEPDITAGDYLHGFFMGTRQALYESGRDSMTITVRRIDARTIGVLIALFERAVGLYANLIHINAYHQPGVEAGKKAASRILELQRDCLGALSKGERYTAEGLASALGENGEEETIYRILTYLHANGRLRATGEDMADFGRFFFV